MASDLPIVLHVSVSEHFRHAPSAQSPLGLRLRPPTHALAESAGAQKTMRSGLGPRAQRMPTLAHPSSGIGSDGRNGLQSSQLGEALLGLPRMEGLDERGELGRLDELQLLLL